MSVGAGVRLDDPKPARSDGFGEAYTKQSGTKPVGADGLLGALRRKEGENSRGWQEGNWTTNNATSSIDQADQWRLGTTYVIE